MDTTVTPAGWYADPTNAALQRYWDGAAWTPHTAPAPPPPGGRPVQVGGVVMAAILPGIGVIVGLVMLVKKEYRTAVAMLVASAVNVSVVWGLLPLMAASGT